MTPEERRQFMAALDEARDIAAREFRNQFGIDPQEYRQALARQSGRHQLLTKYGGNQTAMVDAMLAEASAMAERVVKR